MIRKGVALLKWLSGWMMYLSLLLTFSMLLSASKVSIWVSFPVTLAFVFWAQFNIRRPGYVLVRQSIFNEGKEV